MESEAGQLPRRPLPEPSLPLSLKPSCSGSWRGGGSPVPPRPSLNPNLAVPWVTPGQSVSGFPFLHL